MSVNIKKDDIYLILKNLNLENSRGWDDISIKMIHFYGKAMVEPLRILFLSFLENGLHAFFYKQHFYKQREAETGKKSSKC